MNRGFEYRECVPPEGHDEPLVDYLARRYPHSSHEEWSDRIGAGEVRVGARPALPAQPLRRGQELSWRRPPWEEPAAPKSIEWLYDDGDLLAVRKPAGLPTLPGGGFLERTLLRLVRARAPEAAPLHRLGRWTSGLVLFARTRKSRAALGRQWAAREVRKRYRALAAGSTSSPEFRVDVPIGPVPHALLGSVHAASAVGRPALSRVVVVEQRERDFLCDVKIVTGRPHQIRIHLAAAGHPLVGDPLYPAGGVPDFDCPAVPGDGGYSLHASELIFRHPRTGREVALHCPPQ